MTTNNYAVAVLALHLSLRRHVKEPIPLVAMVTPNVTDSNVAILQRAGILTRRVAYIKNPTTILRTGAKTSILSMCEKKRRGKKRNNNHYN